MTPDELAAIRKRDARSLYDTPQVYVDRRALLAHIDAIAEAVEGLKKGCLGFNEPYHSGCMKSCHEFDRAAVLALLRGTPQR